MSFFGKLKNKLFKSSSKLDEGLDAIVQEGGEEAAPDVNVQEAVAPKAVAEVVEDTPAAPEVIEAPDATEEDVVPGVEPDLDPVDDAISETDQGDVEEPELVRSSDPLQDVVAAAPEETTKPGILGRLLGRSNESTEVRRVLDDDMLESLEELLIQSDMGVETALRVSANIAEGRMGKRLSVIEIKGLLAAEVARIMEPVAKPLPLYPTKPQVVLVVGVNGSGKTTTIGKLASQFRAAGKKVVIAAGDTFRAAAVEQLQVWGDRAGVPVLTAPEGSDPASLAYDAMTKAQEDGADLLMIDTAGRLQNRQDLMEELAKIVRVIRKKDPDAPHNTLLVLDATTGQNAVTQVDMFRKISDVSGLVMTKLDGTARGGVLVSLADKFGLPIHAIGVGEQIDDLAPFDPEEFAAALTGLDQS
ncbi:signal recognition particle-docking protein FtsY [uncultured Pelagimonas sp.]|uniref:signal recognition particle-docking protein FtsY n=1 Tax=uncultured Pelagimonas sp. TaxID=1618102 RepID=UPI002615948D|nr:signal recognition particle-docking protein FtsY [uncultured Pelagimonas sp.]